MTLKSLSALGLAILLCACDHERRFRMPTGAMVPTVKENGYVVANTSVLRPGDIGRWDMVVYRSPDSVKVYGKKAEDLPLYVARIIGLPGETVEFAGQEIMVNGKSLQQLDGQLGITYAGLAPFPPGTRKLGGPAELKLGESEYFYLGDRTATAIDSRFLGPLPLEKVVGKVVRVE